MLVVYTVGSLTSLNQLLVITKEYKAAILTYCDARADDWSAKVTDWSAKVTKNSECVERIARHEIIDDGINVADSEKGSGKQQQTTPGYSLIIYSITHRLLPFHTTDIASEGRLISPEIALKPQNAHSYIIIYINQSGLTAYSFSGPISQAPENLSLLSLIT